MPALPTTRSGTLQTLRNHALGTLRLHVLQALKSGTLTSCYLDGTGGWGLPCASFPNLFTLCTPKGPSPFPPRFQVPCCWPVPKKPLCLALSPHFSHFNRQSFKDQRAWFEQEHPRWALVDSQQEFSEPVVPLPSPILLLTLTHKLQSKPAVQKPCCNSLGLKVKFSSGGRAFWSTFYQQTSLFSLSCFPTVSQSSQ